MVHVICTAVKRFYKVYVDDEDCPMTEAEAIESARLAIEAEGLGAFSDGDIEFDPSDVVSLHYGYTL